MGFSILFCSVCIYCTLRFFIFSYVSVFYFTRLGFSVVKSAYCYINRQFQFAIFCMYYCNLCFFLFSYALFFYLIHLNLSTSKLRVMSFSNFWMQLLIKKYKIRSVGFPCCHFTFSFFSSFAPLVVLITALGLQGVQIF